MLIHKIMENGKTIAEGIPTLAIFSSITLLYDLYWALYFKDSSSFRFKYWIQVGMFYISYMIRYMLIEYKRKLIRKNAPLKNATFAISMIYLIISLIIGAWSIIYNDTVVFILFSILFLIPLIFMLADTFRFIPADECLTYVCNYIKDLVNYSIKPSPKKVCSVDEKYFLNQKDEGKFIVEQVSPENFHPALKLTIFATITSILYYFAWEKTFNNNSVALIIFFIYISILLTYYRKDYYDTLSELGTSVNIHFKIKRTEIFDKFIRRSAYIFFYGYFVYWIFSVSHFKSSTGPNFFNVFISSLLSIDLVIFFAYLLYFLGITGAMAMVSDGFGIVPVICNLSKDISLQIKQMEKNINLYHPDKSAGFRPLGNFCLKMSFLIALPFIIGMPIQLYRYYISTNKQGIINYLIDDPFNVAFMGVGLAGATIFIFSIYYINKLIEEAKKEKLKFLMDIYKDELKECKLDTPSPKITCIDSAIKKIESVVLPPYGKTNVIRFYSALLVPSVSIVIGLKII